MRETAEIPNPCTLRRASDNEEKAFLSVRSGHVTRIREWAGDSDVFVVAVGDLRQDNSAKQFKVKWHAD